MPRHSDATKAAIKNAVDIVALVGDYLQIHRSGSKYKALCPFHDDHNPSLELNPERQSYKCWSCGAGGDVFDFVQNIDKVDFPEALRMLADRAGIMLESPSTAVAAASRGPSKTELLAVNAWAEDLFEGALLQSSQALAYLQKRGITEDSVKRFRLGYAPEERGWLVARARRKGFSAEVLEAAGLISRSATSDRLVRERFRGRLIFPIHDGRGRSIGFGGRILPEVEQSMASRGKNVAKYLNSPETVLFQKRRILYAADLARAACREMGWVAVVEGYTDVIAAHQVGLGNVVGTLGTALGDDHVQALRRLADRVVLVFDGDAAGQAAADRALELFLGHELDVRVLSLPANLDPCEYLLNEGAAAFRDLLERADDPLGFVLRRAETLFDFGSIEGSRRAADWVLGILSSLPFLQRSGADLLDTKNITLNKTVDALADRLSLPVEPLKRRLKELRRVASRSRAPRGVGELPVPAGASRNDGEAAEAALAPIRFGALDPIDRELVQIVLNEPGTVAWLVSRVAASSLRDGPLRVILQTCYDLQGEGQVPSCEHVMLRVEDPQIRALAAGLTLPMDSSPLPEDVRPAPWQDRLKGVLATLAERERQNRLRDLRRALEETDEHANPDAFRALELEYRRLLNQRPGTK